MYTWIRPNACREIIFFWDRSAEIFVVSVQKPEVNLKQIIKKQTVQSNSDTCDEKFDFHFVTKKFPTGQQATSALKMEAWRLTLRLLPSRQSQSYWFIWPWRPLKIVTIESTEGSSSERWSTLESFSGILKATRSYATSSRKYSRAWALKLRSLWQR